MKRLTKIILIMISLFIGIINVYADDKIYSINKYDNEKFLFIKNSYDNNENQDGLITIGTYLKETINNLDDTSYDNYQIMLVKYKKDGKLVWTYRYGKTSSENISALLYSYDLENNIDGYLMVINNSYDILNETEGKSYFIKIDLNGNFVFEKETNLTENIKKIIPTYSVNNEFTGYIAITDKSIVKYDKDLNLILKKEYDNYYIDIVNISQGGYAIIRKIELNDNNYDIQLVKYNEELIEEVIIDNNINKYTTYNLENSNEGFIIYGITEDVKLKKGKKSYYIINYDNEGHELWETIGNTAIKENTNIYLYSINKNNLNNYFMLYKNNDNSYEVIKLNEEGIFERKVKKIKNDYYDFLSFIIDSKEKVYFVGQIKCPEDDYCDYNSNSLLLISDEDTVIEVKDSTSTYIIISIIIIIIISISIFYYIKKRKNIN